MVAMKMLEHTWHNFITNKQLIEKNGPHKQG
jgi:hypothetical protein